PKRLSRSAWLSNVVRSRRPDNLDVMPTACAVLALRSASAQPFGFFAQLLEIFRFDDLRHLLLFLGFVDLDFQLLDLGFQFAFALLHLDGVVDGDGGLLTK